MKKTSIILLCTVLFSVFVGCGKDDEIATKEPPKAAEHSALFDPIVAVDLGLSVKWASTSLSTWEEELVEGIYERFNWEPKTYQWGDIEQCRTRYNKDWSIYKWGSSWDEEISKYGGKADNKTALDIEDDVAHVELGGKWRLPTKDEIQELADKCKLEIIKIPESEGHAPSLYYKEAWKITGPNGKSIIFPLERTDLYDTDNLCWSSSLDPEKPWLAYCLYVQMSYGPKLEVITDWRADPLPIHAVCD